MIYLDNAATSLIRPREVVDAVSRALVSFGGVGRGVHEASIAAGMAVLDAREAVNGLLDGPGADRVSFAPNATVALNIAVGGLLPDGGCALTTAASHNSVLRPLFRARDLRKCEVRMAPHDVSGALDWDAFEQMASGCNIVVMTHASNLTGDVYDVRRAAEIVHLTGGVFVLDAAQTAGSIPVSMQELGVDVLCFTGHKGLLGPQGTGGLIVSRGVDIPPLLEGGSGTHSFDERHPRFMPEALEAGTLNAHGLAGLAAAVAYLQREGVKSIANHERVLADAFIQGVSDVEDIRILGGGGVGGTGIVSFNLGDVDSALVADLLATEWGICTRAGAHCAPLMHKALGTERQGAVRVSFGPFNTIEDAQAAARAVCVIAGEVLKR